MPKSKFPRIASRKASSNPVSLGLQVTRQIVSLLGGGSDPSSQSTTTSLQAALTANTAAVIANTSARTAENAAASLTGGVSGLVDGGDGLVSGTGSGSGGLGGFFGTLLGGFSSFLGIASLASNLFHLFSGSSQPPSVLTPYRLPQPLSLEVANTDNILAGLPRVDRSADGSPRTFGPDSTTSPPQPLQVNVNVNAIDSRSFADHAPALADAVRQAMLNMDPINQLIRESL